MKIFSLSLVLVLASHIISSCVFDEQVKDAHQVDLKLEHTKILDCLNSETTCAFGRDYDQWKSHWIHRDDITKTYINYVDSSFSESIGWAKISAFVKEFMDDHPDPEPAPKSL